MSGDPMYANEYLPADNRTGILVGIFTEMYGAAGKWAIGIATALACLTTSVGLTGVAGNFFTRVFKKDENLSDYSNMQYYTGILHLPVRS